MQHLCLLKTLLCKGTAHSGASPHFRMGFAQVALNRDVRLSSRHGSILCFPHIQHNAWFLLEVCRTPKNSAAGQNVSFRPFSISRHMCSVALIWNNFLQLIIIILQLSPLSCLHISLLESSRSFFLPDIDIHFIGQEMKRRISIHFLCCSLTFDFEIFESVVIFALPASGVQLPPPPPGEPGQSGGQAQHSLT